jgi:YHS domain-containing protein
MPDVYEGILDDEKIEGMHLEIKDHLEKNVEDECAYCGQLFGPDEIAIEKEIHGRKWRFCSDECYKDFKDASDFKDQDLDAEKELAVDPDLQEDEPEDEN